MPRKANKTPGPTNQGGYQGQGNPGGGATQPATAATGLQYGEHQALVDAQAAMPLPAASPIPTAAPPGAPVSGGNARLSLHDALLQAAQGMQGPQGSLDGPSARPLEPVTAGLSTGAGPGPEILGRRPPGAALAETLSAVAEANGDPQLVRLAELARTVMGTNTPVMPATTPSPAGMPVQLGTGPVPPGR